MVYESLLPATGLSRLDNPLLCFDHAVPPHSSLNPFSAKLALVCRLRAGSELVASTSGGDRRPGFLLPHKGKRYNAPSPSRVEPIRASQRPHVSGESR